MSPEAFQAQIEQEIGLTAIDADFINKFGNTPVVNTFKKLLSINVKNQDRYGLNLLEASLKEVRGLAVEHVR